MSLNLFRTLAEMAEGRSHAQTKISTDDLFRTPLWPLQVGGEATSGGFTVPTDVGPVIPALFPFSAVIRAGAQVVTIKQNRSLPKVTASVTAAWVGEYGQEADPQLTLGEVNEQPRRICAVVEVSKKLLVQAPELAEPMINRNVREAIGYAIDQGSCNGIGGIEPIGLLQADGVAEPVTFGGAAALLDFCAFEKTVGDQFGEQGPLTFIGSVAAREKLRQTQKWSGSSTALWSDDDKIIGHGAIATPAISNSDSRMLFGCFSLFQIVFFGETIITKDDLTGAKSGLTTFIFNLFCNAAPLNAEAFSRSTDSAAQ
jgi:hypothetical protein